MKKLIVILSFVLSGSVLMAQDRYHHTPDKVQRSFNNEYPQASRTRWSYDNSQWTAEFRQHGHGQMMARYGRDGEHIDTRDPLNKKDVPVAVKDRIKERYPHARRMEYTRIERQHGNDQFYKVKLNRDGHDMIVYMDARGRERGYYDRH